jgi:hypothetical protein
MLVNQNSYMHNSKLFFSSPFKGSFYADFSMYNIHAYGGHVV